MTGADEAKGLFFEGASGGTFVTHIDDAAALTISGGAMPSRDHLLPISSYSPTFLERIAGTGVLLLTMLPIIAERSSAALLPVVALTLAALARFERQNISLIPSGTAIILWSALGYSALSAIWALDPADTLAHVGAAAVMLASAQMVTSWIGVQGETRLRFLAFWLVVGVCVGIAYLLIETVSMQGIKRLLMNTFLLPDTSNKMYQIDEQGNISIQRYELNRNVAAANLLLWPALLCAYRVFRSPFRLILCAIIFAAIVFVTFSSVHETSKIALLLATPVFAAAIFKPRWALFTVLTGLVVTIVAIVPLSIYAHQSLHLDKSTWLQFSAQQRIIIWGTLADRVSDAPILGVGVRSTYAMNLAQRAEDREEPQPGSSGIAPHAHNVYLQMWFELGAIGALLMALCGLAFLLFVSKLDSRIVPFALAALTTGFIEVASSWDIWQRWFFALLAISCVAVFLSSRLGSAPVENLNDQS